MGTITVLRPSATSSGVGWTPSTGTLHGVTSDNSDSTYATWGGSGSALILATPIDSPPTGERRHQVRLRARGEDGDAWWAVRLASGALVAGAAAQFTSSPTTVTGSWGFGAPPDGPTVLSTYVTGQSSGLKIEELYLDMDSRLAPTFTPQVLDGGGTVTTTVSDTAQPNLRASNVDTDDLAARQYRYWVTLSGAVVWDTGLVSGSAAIRQTSPLTNGDYTAHFQVWSTLGSNTAYASDEETVDFTVAIGTVAVPGNPVVTPVPGTPFFSLEVCAPGVVEFDEAEASVEIQRVDCPYGGYLSLPGVVDAYASTPNADGPPPDELQITVHAQRSDGWRPATNQTMVAKYVGLGDNRSFVLGLDLVADGNPALAGHPYLFWSEDGDDVNTHIVGATERMPIDGEGAVTLRVLFQADTGAGDYAVTFSTLDLDGVTWVQLGDVITGTGPAPMFWSVAPFEVGSADLGAFEPFEGRIYSVEIREGATGTVLANPDFSNQMAGADTFTDEVGNFWTINGSAALTSDQSLVSVAMVGPLSSYECGSAVDYSLPRTGIGSTCDHPAEMCCSYYRARTVGRVNGLIQISAWSDFYQAPAPAQLRSDYTDSDTWITIEHLDPLNGWPAVGGNPYNAMIEDEEVRVIGISVLGTVAEVDGTFEDGVDGFGWRSEGCSFTGSTVRGSQGTTASVLLTVDDSPNQAIFRSNSAFVRPEVSPGESYVVTMDVWTDIAMPITAALDWRDDDDVIGTVLATFDIPANAWTSIGVYGTAPVGTTTIEYGPTLLAPAPDDGIQYYVDEINVRQTDVNDGYQLLLVQRGVNGTTAVPHEAGTPITLVVEPDPPEPPEEFCLVWDDDEHLIRTEGPSGPLQAAIGGQLTWDRDRPFTSSIGVMGTRFVTSASPGGRNLHLTTAVESEAELATLQTVLARPLVLVSPSDSAEVWAAPVASSVRVIKVGRVRQVTADFIATGPQPGPQLADVT